MFVSEHPSGETLQREKPLRASPYNHRMPWPSTTANLHRATRGCNQILR